MPPAHAPREPFSVRMVSSLTRALGLYGQQEHPVTNFSDLDDDGDTQGQSSWFDTWRKDTYTPVADRKERYRIFNDMDYGLVSSILDAYAEEATQVDYTKEKSIWVESSDAALVKEGSTFFRNVQIEDTIYSITREMCKYGDHFRFLHYATGKGVLGWRPASPDVVTRTDDYLGRLAGFSVDGMKFRKKTSDLSYPFDMLHFRLLQGKAGGQYGLGLLDPLFTPWRQLTLAEDTILMYSFRRAASRNLIMVDTGAMGEAASMQYLNSVRKKFRKHEFVDPASAGYKKQFNPMTTVEDIFLPIRGENASTRVEQLAGAADGGALADVDHFRRKFFGTARIPQAFLGFEGDINAKATLAAQDVRFARSVKRVRRSLLYGIRRGLELHYSFLPTDPERMLYDPEKPDSFTLRMAPINALDEFERMELIKAKVDLLEAMAQLGDTLRLPKAVWGEYVLREHARLPEDIIKKLISGMEATTAPDGTPTESKGYGSFSATEKEAMTEAFGNAMGLRTSVNRLEEYYIDESTRPPARVDSTETLQETDPAVIKSKGEIKMLYEAVKAAKQKAPVNG